MKQERRNPTALAVGGVNAILKTDRNEAQTCVYFIQECKAKTNCAI